MRIRRALAGAAAVAALTGGLAAGPAAAAGISWAGAQAAPAAPAAADSTAAGVEIDADDLYVYSTGGYIRECARAVCEEKSWTYDGEKLDFHRAVTGASGLTWFLVTDSIGITGYIYSGNTTPGNF